jgi:Asp-tRNA(Asn)/Glu-tRNA(Gln) amidotransferase A subunit family amidase
VALGSDTGGSIRIPAAFTGVVGHKTTKGRWPTDGVVQLSSTFDTVGALTRSVEDSICFFGSADPKWGDPESRLESLESMSVDGQILDDATDLYMRGGIGRAECHALAASAAALFEHADVLVLAGNMITPPPVSDVVEDLEEYVRVNVTTLRPTCPVNLLQLCAVSIPVGLDTTGMPVGLQLVARGGDDELLLGVAWAVERHLGTDRMGPGR